MKERERHIPERDGVPMYDSDFVAELVREGHSHADAVRVASGEMDGANETPEGTIRSTQTDCNNLHYKETLEESKEAKRAEILNKQRVEAELGLKEGDDIDDAVDAWIAAQERKLGRR
ncbi:MAG: hypothetical protein XD87_0442 [candidate division WS6 bacterium 36_33]|uniref:Uncharacterized protein n=1 Tax=candidate division WS6 bacterium 36_33 TaxID=1641388 RepID=A0A101GYC6_9BACT|nr:MAG: hypothetical protein XD87_0442 [candidate division WS6 bacterium 36_33]